MLLPAFELHQPTSIDEAVALMTRFGAKDADWLAGGSDLLCNYKWGLNSKPHVIALSKVNALTTMELGRMGSMVRLADIARSAALGVHLPALVATARKIASVLIQEQATIGGNLMLDTRCHFFNQSYLWRRSLGYCLKADGDLCHVIPKIKRDGKLVDNRFECVATNSSDLAPLLIALGASLEFASTAGTRQVALKDFYRHDGIQRFAKQPEELLVAVCLPAESRGMTAGYKKLRPRESWDFPVLGVAAALRLKAGSRVVEELRLCVNAVDTIPIVFDDFTAGYTGRKLDAAAIDEIAAHVRANVQPKLNVPMEPGYRRKMAEVFTRRLLTELADEADQASP